MNVRITIWHLTLPTAVLLALTTPAVAQPQSDTSAASSLPDPASIPANAGTQVPADTGTLEASVPASDFHLSVTPYFWATNFSGSIKAGGIEVDIDKTVSDILNGSDRLFGLMGAVDLDYKRFVFELNAAWGTVEGSEQKDIHRNGTLDATVDVDGAFSELFAGYRFVDTPFSDAPDAKGRFKLDAFAGGRVTAINVDMSLNATASVTLPSGDILTAGQSARIEQSGDWFEPFVGIRGIFELDEHWMFNLRGDVGGFGVEGSQFAWQAAAVFGYRWHCDGWDFAVIGGYRALSQDYSSGDFTWDVITHGPLLGASFAWEF